MTTLLTHTRTMLVFAAGVLTSALVVAGAGAASAQSGLQPNPDTVRFQLVGDEPIAGPDGRTLVNGWKVLMFRDRRTDECYAAFTRGSDIAVAAPRRCGQ